MQKIILVTGASRGLGREIARSLSSKNKMYAAARNSQEIEKGKNIRPIRLDITSEKDCREAVAEIIKNEGRIDVLINNAGYTLTGPSIEFEAGDFEKILGTNLVGTFKLIKCVVPYMKKQGGGRIINITSLNGIISLPNFGPYSASKHGLEALGIALRYELKEFGIWITNLAPGAIASEEKVARSLTHKPAREKFKLLYLLMPMLTRKEVAAKIGQLIASSHPPAQVIMGADAKITTFLKRLLPSFVWDYLMAYVWSKK